MTARTPIVIVGHGLAGALLGWRLEQAGVPFCVLERPGGGAASASRVAAGLVTPLTGRRLAPTWGIAEGGERAWAVYRDLEAVLGVPLVRPVRLRRLYREPADAARWAARRVDPAVERWVEATDEAGWWLRGAFQVETARLLEELRDRWRQRAGWREVSEAALTEVVEGASKVIWCTGADLPARFPDVPWERAHGEILTGELSGVRPPAEVRNDGHWVLPREHGQVRVGATYGRDAHWNGPTAAGREELMRAARRLTGAELQVVSHDGGWRLTTPDRRPVVGWHGSRPGWGVCGGLASKGVLWAPLLADAWRDHLCAGAAFPPQMSIERFDRRRAGD